MNGTVDRNLEMIGEEGCNGFVSRAILCERSEIRGRTTLHGLADERRETKSVAIDRIDVAASRKQLGREIEVGTDFAGAVDEVLGDGKRGRVTVVETKAVKDGGHLFSVFLHVIPEPGVFRGRGTEKEFDAIRPYNELSVEIDGTSRGFGCKERLLCEILKVCGLRSRQFEIRFCACQLV